MSISIKASNLVRRFADTTALDGVSFEISAGELFGFIGPDGGGKTTLFRILVTLLKPDDGTATVLGLDVVRDLWAIRQRVGYMPGRFSLYPDLSVEENLRFFASVFDTTIEASYEQIAPIYEQIAPFKDRRAAALSGGMKQKLALCCALVHKPEVLFLDEPTTGVDAVSRREFWDLLGRLRAGGLTIVVSTPYMDEADRCDRVALIQHGKLLAVDTPAAIANSFDRPLIGVHASKRYDALLALRRFPHAHSVLPFGAVHHYTDERADAPADQVMRELREFLRSEGIDADVTTLQPTVEDTFIARMGEPPARADLKVGLYDPDSHNRRGGSSAPPPRSGRG
ncbi:MAG TPA: ABC transporter ATP-binding protein [Vicinamibacterales bacterium]|nr:ABC transporter ATP-binding protein [Vicinamibacterales bacterium]